MSEKPQRSSISSVFGFIAILLVVVLAAAIWLLARFSFYVAWVLACSVTTFAFYGYDKAMAKVGGMRVPEVVLHGLALVGGFAGGWLGMFAFRHKLRHPSFFVVLAFGTVIHTMLCYVLYNDALSRF